MTRSILVPVVLLGVLVGGCGVDSEPDAVAPQASETAQVELVLNPAKGKPIVEF